MIKAVTNYNRKEDDIRKIGVEVRVEYNNDLELQLELEAILDTFEEKEPEILLKALIKKVEGLKHDN